MAEVPAGGDTFAGSLGYGGKDCLSFINPSHDVPGETRDAMCRQMKNLIFAPTHKSYEKMPITVGHALGSFMNEQEGTWHPLPILCRDVTKFTRPVVPFLRVCNETNTMRLVYVVYGNSSTLSCKRTIMYNLENGHGEALSNSVRIVQCLRCQPELLDSQVRYVIAALGKHVTIADPMCGDNLYMLCKDSMDVVEKTGVSLLVVDGLKQEEKKSTPEHTAFLKALSNCVNNALKHKQIVTLFKQIAKNKWTTVSAPKPPFPKPAALNPPPAASPSKKRAAASDDEPVDEPANKKKMRKDDGSGEASMSDSGSDLGSDSDDDEEESDEVDDSEEEEEDDSDDDEPKKKTNAAKPSSNLKTLIHLDKAQPSNVSLVPSIRQNGAGPLNEGRGSTVKEREEVAQCSDDKEGKKRKPAREKREQMALNIRRVLEQGKSLDDAVPAGHWDRLQSKMEDASNTLCQYVNVGKKEEEQDHIMALAALVGECFTAMAKLGTQGGPRAPDSATSRKLALTLARVYEREQPQIEELSNFLTEWAAKTVEMKCVRARSVMEAEQAAAQLPRTHT